MRLAIGTRKSRFEGTADEGKANQGSAATLGEQRRPRIALPPAYMPPDVHKLAHAVSHVMQRKILPLHLCILQKFRILYLY